MGAVGIRRCTRVSILSCDRQSVPSISLHNANLLAFALERWPLLDVQLKMGGKKVALVIEFRRAKISDSVQLFFLSMQLGGVAGQLDCFSQVQAASKGTWPAHTYEDMTDCEN